MKPQNNLVKTPNTLADWINSAPTIEASAQRWGQIVRTPQSK